MSWIVLIIVGGVIGWLASMVMKTNAQMGVVANVLVGIFGSILGGWLAPTIGIVPTGIGVYLIAVAGSVLLIFLLKLIGVFR